MTISFRKTTGDILDKIKEKKDMDALLANENQAAPETINYASNLGYQLVRDKDNGTWVIYEKSPLANDEWLVMDVFNRLSEAKAKLRGLKELEDKHYDQVAEQSNFNNEKE